MIGRLGGEYSFVAPAATAIKVSIIDVVIAIRKKEGKAGEVDRSGKLLANDGLFQSQRRIDILIDVITNVDVGATLP